MRLKQILSLFRLNLIYVNPQGTSQLRKKKKRSIYSSIFLQYGLLSLVFLVIYGLMFVAIDFVKYPGYFTFYVGLFTALTFLQSIYSIFNVFYESKDLVHFMPLPFRQSDIFIAKMLSVILTSFPFLLPIFCLFILTAIHSNYSLLFGLFIAIFLFVLLTLLITEIGICIVHLLTKTSLFTRHKKIATTFLMLVTTLGMVVAIFFANQQNSNYTFTNERMPDTKIIYPFHLFHEILTKPFSSSAGTAWLILLGMFLLLNLFLFKWIIPSFYQTANRNVQITMTKKGKTHKNSRQPRNMAQFLRKYNLDLIKDPSLLTQLVINSIMFPIIIIGPMIATGPPDLQFLTSKYFGVVFLIGLVVSQFSMNPMALVSLMISLDRENFDYFKTLPISLKNYLQHKFNFALAAQLILPTLILIGFSLFFKIPFLLVIGLLAGCAIGTFVGAMFYFYRDYRLLNLDWQNISELANRGGGNFLTMFVLFGSMIVGTIIIGICTFLTVVLSGILAIVLNIIILLIAAVITFFMYLHYQKIFWSKLS